MIKYTYDSNGIRTSKTIDGVKTTYQLDGTKIVSETTDENIKWFIYDNDDSVIGFGYNENAYYFEKNAQGDVVRIFNANGDYVSEYFYDAWGNIASISGNEEIANANPFRYRGYYYDNESGFYYLQSRYYDSVTGRFLNADEQINDNGIIGTNLFTYCNNNPINMVDYEGKYGTLIIMGMYYLAFAIVTICLTSIITSSAFINGWYQMCSVISGGILRGIKSLGVAFSWANSQAQSIARSIGLSFAKVKVKPKYRSNHEYHHIVARKSYKASVARNILTRIKISVDNNENIVNIKTGLHRRLHTNLYYGFVNIMVAQAYNNGKISQRKNRVIQALRTIKGMIQTMDNTAPF